MELAERRRDDGTLGLLKRLYRCVTGSPPEPGTRVVRLLFDPLLKPSDAVSLGGMLCLLRIVT